MRSDHLWGSEWQTGETMREFGRWLQPMHDRLVYSPDSALDLSGLWWVGVAMAVALAVLLFVTGLRTDPDRRVVKRKKEKTS